MTTETLTLTVEEAGVLLGLARNAAYQGVNCGQIPSIRIGRRLLVPRAALEKLMASAGVGALPAVARHQLYRRRSLYKGLSAIAQELLDLLPSELIAHDD